MIAHMTNTIVAYPKLQWAEPPSISIDNKESLLGLSENIIFNCLGLGSKEVFNDDDLQPVRGQLIYFKAQEGVDYLAGLTLRDGPIYTCLFPYKDKFILGGSYEVGESERMLDQDVLDGILKLARSAFGQITEGNDEL